MQSSKIKTVIFSNNKGQERGSPSLHTIFYFGIFLQADMLLYYVKRRVLHFIGLWALSGFQPKGSMLSFLLFFSLFRLSAFQLKFPNTFFPTSSFIVLLTYFPHLIETLRFFNTEQNKSLCSSRAPPHISAQTNFHLLEHLSCKILCQNPQLTVGYILTLVTARLSSSVGNFITGTRCGSVTGLVVSMVTRCRLDVNYSKRSRISPKLNIASFTTTVDLISDQKPSFITNTHWIISKVGHKLRIRQGCKNRQGNKTVPLYPIVCRVSG